MPLFSDRSYGALIVPNFVVWERQCFRYFVKLSEE